MVSFKYLMFIALAVCAVSADEPRASGDGKKVQKKHAYIAAAPAPLFAYSATVPATYPYAYAAYPSYAAYSSHPLVHGKYWPGKYEKVNSLNLAAYGYYPRDSGKHWPGKYGKPYQPAHNNAYPIPYHY